jgi:hypothetical protein
VSCLRTADMHLQLEAMARTLVGNMAESTV